MTEINKDNISLVKLIYILIIVSTIVGGITAAIGLVMAYVNKNSTSEWLQTHFQFQIRTCWIGFLYILLGVLTYKILIGIVILLFTFFWIVIRCAKGLKQLENDQAIKNVNSWLLG